MSNDTKALVMAIFDMDEQELDTVQAALINRRKYLISKKAAEVMSSVYVGDRVRIEDQVKPKLLAGATGKVVAIKGDKLVVDLDLARGKWYRGITMPPSLLFKLAPL